MRSNQRKKTVLVSIDKITVYMKAGKNELKLVKDNIILVVILVDRLVDDLKIFVKIKNN